MKTACVISVGCELILGQTVDTNGAWLARELAGVGIRVKRLVTVDDAVEPMVEVLRESAAMADVVLITGGLGPTADDLTRQALTDASDDELVFDPKGWDDICALLSVYGREIPEANKVQAMRPSRARLIHNTCGSAPGIHVSLDETPTFAMPGVPYEMKRMFAERVLPTIASKADGGVVMSTELRTTGMSECEVGSRLSDLMEHDSNPRIGTTASLGEIAVKINVQADTRDEAERIIDAARIEICHRLGDAVWGEGDQTLAGAVGTLLKTQGLRLAVAESCTGGLIAKYMTDVAGCSEYFVGGAVTYANEAKRDILGVDPKLLEEFGAVSEPVALAMVEGVKRRFNSDCAIAVTGIAGPGGGTETKPVGLIYVGWSTPTRTWVEQRRLGEKHPRAVIRERIVRIALDALRRQILSETGHNATIE